eukprot:9794978-Ditylum_brightwellii.AAC.1
MHYFDNLLNNFVIDFEEITNKFGLITQSSRDINLADDILCLQHGPDPIFQLIHADQPSLHWFFTISLSPQADKKLP